MYGTRTCLECEGKFEATYASQLTCSEKCRKARLRKCKRLSYLRKVARLEECERLHTLVDEQKKRITDLEARLQAMGQDI